MVGPRPKPDDLPEPTPTVAPQADEQAELAQMFEQLPEVDSVSAQEPAPEAQVGQAEIDALFAPPSADEIAETGPSFPTSEEDADVPIGKRTLSKFGRTPEEQANILKAVIPGADVKVENDELFILRQGEKEYKRVDPKQVKGFTKRLREFAADTADFAPEIADTILGLGLGAGGAIAGGVPGLVAGEVAAGAAQTGIREGILSATGAERTIDPVKDAAINSLIGVGTLGLGAVLKKPIENIGRAIGSGIKESARIGQLSKIAEGVDSFRQSFGLPVRKGAELGTAAASALDATYKKHINDVGLLNREALQAAESTGVTRVPAENLAQRLKGLLSSRGIVFDPVNGRAKIPGAKEPENLLKVEGIMDINAPAKKAVPTTKSIYDDLLPEEQVTVRNLAGTYNEIAGAGGLSVQKMQSLLELYGERGQFNAVKKSGGEKLYNSAREALTNDRDEAYDKLLPGNETLAAANERFTTNIENLRELSRLADRSPEKFAKAMISPGRSDLFDSAEAVLGSNPAVWSNVKTAWFDDILERSIDPKTGIVSPDVIKAEFKKYDKTVINRIFTAEQRRGIDALLARADRIPYMDLVQDVKAQGYITAALRAASSGEFVWPKVAFVYKLFSSNAKNAEWLANEGLLRIAKTIKDPEGRTATLRAAEGLRRWIAASRVRVRGDGRETLHLPVKSITAGVALESANRKLHESDEDFLARKKLSEEALEQERFE